MRAKKVETLAWLLIYSGLLLLSLGLFLRRSQDWIGLALIAFGVADAVAGVLMIWLRSRMPDDSKENQ